MSRSWHDLLDALEERNTRVAAGLEGAEVDVPELEMVADGPLPEALQVRAAVLLDATVRLEQRLAERRLALVRTAAYASY